MHLPAFVFLLLRFNLNFSNTAAAKIGCTFSKNILPHSCQKNFGIHFLIMGKMTNIYQRLLATRFNV